MNFLGILQVFFFVFFVSDVRSIDVLDPENQPGSGFIRIGSRAYRERLTPKYENKKEGFQNYLEYSFNSILNVVYRSRYSALDPEFGKNRIHITVLNQCCGSGSVWIRFIKK